jgi:DNA-binding response OmpR family regulator
MISPQNREHYGVMQNNISRLIRLLQQILEFRKAETGNLKLKVSNDNLAVFLRKEVESLRPLMKKKKIHLSVVCDPENIMGYFDPDKLDKIVYNLLSNASKYNSEGGFVQVNLSCDSNKEYAILTVKDNGKGIPPEKIKTLFKRFYEGDYRRFNTIGTGIGLALTKDLVELHQGTIIAESEVDKGTIFTVRIPIDRSFYSDDEIDEIDDIFSEGTISDLELSVPEPEKTTEAKSHSLLVIEDNDELLQLMTQLLSREYNVLTAQNGKEGISIVENEDIDLIVSDIMMPEMNGIEFCKHIKNNFETCHIPLILLTAKSKEEDRIEAYDSGADGFISKPFKLTVLHAKIKNLLKNKERVAKDFKKQLVFEMKELSYTSMDEDFLQRAIDCVYKHLDDSEFDQQQFVDEMDSSKSTLYKKLKSLTGLNTSAFIRNIRLKAACKIIEDNKNIRISELAYTVGFNDPKYFSACFKKEFGMLPSEYIERYMPESFVPEPEENE